MKTETKNKYAKGLGRLGGLAGRGKSKARKVTTAQARRAANARWANERADAARKLALELSEAGK